MTERPHILPPPPGGGAIKREGEHGAAFFDLDRTLIAGSLVVPVRPRGVQGRDAHAAATSPATPTRTSCSACAGSTDAGTDAVRERVGEDARGREGARPAAALRPACSAGVLPRLYPRMLELAYEHQDAGRPIFICTAAAQEMAELMAIVLTFDGAVGSRGRGDRRRLHRAARAARSTTARARRRRSASWPRARTSTSPRPTRTRDSRVRPADAAARRASCGGQSGQGAGARGARGGVGDHAVRATRAQAARRRGGGAARRARVRGADGRCAR